MQTLATIRSRVRARLSEASTRFFTNENVAAWINEAQDNIAADSPWLYQSTIQTLTVPGVEQYQLPAEVIVVKNTRMATLSGAIYRLDFVDPPVMDQFKNFHTNATSSTSILVTYRSNSAGIYLEIYRAPSASVILRCEVLKRPTYLVNDDDICDIPAFLTHVIVDYAYWQAKIKDEETAQADRAQAVYEQDLQDLRTRRQRIQVDQMNRTRPFIYMGR